MVHLMDDLVLQVPGEDQDVVGPGLIDCLDRTDRDVHAGGEAAVLVGVSVDREVEEIGSDSAIVEERIALAGRTVPADPFALVLGRDQERKEVAFRPPCLFAEGRVCRHLHQPVPLLAVQEFGHAVFYRPTAALVGEVDAERTAVRRQLLDVD
jgi:hypothetical protein